MICKLAVYASHQTRTLLQRTRLHVQACGSVKKGGVSVRVSFSIAKKARAPRSPSCATLSVSVTDN